VASSTTSRLPFLVAVALLAAALGDALVESISNTGIFGTRYFDNNHLSVVPTLIAGGALALEGAVARCVALYRCALDARRDARRDWLGDAATSIATHPPLRDVPAVFAMQLVALFAMESSEQLLFGGKLLGGTAWLGGPVLFSLGLHALLALACTFLLGWTMRGIAAAFASFVVSAIACIAITLPREGSAMIRRRRDVPAFARPQSPHARQIGERAPPFLPTPA
jgi:hypothetical protein